jgi:pre-mRNA-splicing factor ATP-dependent RNA helicase DHX16
VVYNQLVYTSAEFMRSVVEIKPQWLNEIAPHFYSIGDTQDDSDKKLANTKNLGRAATRK